MIISLSNIKSKDDNQIDLEYQIDIAPIDYYGDRIIISEPASLRGKLYHINKKTFLDCIIRAELQVNCSRCLMPFYSELCTKLTTELLNEQEEANIDDGDDVIFYQDDIIDLGKIVREQILMNIPLKMLCHEDCKGLCAQCGTNKNEKQCQCQLDNDEDEEKVDFRLSKLKELFHKD